jgi:hypothetical protein
MAYMPDAQIQRILGQNDRYQIQEGGIIVDMASMEVQQDPETGEEVEVPTLTANIRDIRNIEYNLAAEEAPGNMTKRMLELTALMEMQAQGFPVDPNQIIDKMDIPASDKKRWMDYIASQQEQQAAQEQEQMETQVALEQAKIETTKEGNMLDFISDMAKVKQMTQKDEVRSKEEIMKLGSKERNDLMTFIVSIAGTLADVEATEAEMQRDEESHIADERREQQSHVADIRQKEDKHQQMMRHLKEKNALAIKLAKEKPNVKSSSEGRKQPTASKSK